MVGLLSFSLSPRTSLPLLRTLNGGMATACSALISLMALHIGGIASAYLHGISIVIMVQSIMVPAPWREILKIAAPCALSFPCVVGVAMLITMALMYPIHRAVLAKQAASRPVGGAAPAAAPAAPMAPGD